ncbi:Ff.00g075600.m01.CDS01 [Fusarium sp. VM40]|nr:Ff.00g075600.m01.CDS01 [Fusarium sp. VM40]
MLALLPTSLPPLFSSLSSFFPPLALFLPHTYYVRASEPTDASSRRSSDASSRRSSQSRAAADGDNEVDEDAVAVNTFVNNDEFFIISESFIQTSRRRPNVKQGVNTSENAEKFREEQRISSRALGILRHSRARDLDSMRNEFNTRLLEQAKCHIGNDDDDMMMPQRTQSTWTKVSQKITKRSLSLTPMPSLRLVGVGQAVEAFPDEIVDVPGSVSALDYAAAAKAAMEVWLSFGTDQYALGTKPKQQSVCQLCVDRDSVYDEAKRKLWQSHHLRRHQDSGVHSQFKQFSRRAQRLALDNGLDSVVCELFSTLARHIRDSSEQKLVATEADCNWWKDGSFDTHALAIAHDELKYAGGWYDD